MQRKCTRKWMQNAARAASGEALTCGFSSDNGTSSCHSRKSAQTKATDNAAWQRQRRAKMGLQQLQTEAKTTKKEAQEEKPARGPPVRDHPSQPKTNKEPTLRTPEGSRQGFLHRSAANSKKSAKKTKPSEPGETTTADTTRQRQGCNSKRNSDLPCPLRS
jgi:hypothetical protein